MTQQPAPFTPFPALTADPPSPPRVCPPPPHARLSRHPPNNRAANSSVSSRRQSAASSTSTSTSALGASPAGGAVALVAAHPRTNDLRVVAAGGDGTVSGVSELIRDACALANTRAVPPIAILRLGTGNELANVTGWGKRYATGDSLVPFVRDVAGGRVVGVDAWIWRATPLETGPDGRVLDVPRRNARPPPRVVGARALHDFDGNPGGDAGADGAAGPGGFFSAAAASWDVLDGGPSSPPRRRLRDLGIRPGSVAAPRSAFD